MLRLDYVSCERYFSSEAPVGTAGPPDSTFTIKSLEKVDGTEGQYILTVSAAKIDHLWEETQLAVVVAGSDMKISTEPFKAVMMPKPFQGIKATGYPAASFYMFDSIEDLENFSGGKRSRSVLKLSSIYYALNSREFVTGDKSKETRSYTADFIESVRFVPVNDSVAPVFVVFDKEKRVIRFDPDTAATLYTSLYWPDKDPNDKGGLRLWRNFQDSSGIKHEQIFGQLILTDRWNGEDTIKNFSIGWYNSNWFANEMTTIKKGLIDDDDNGIVNLTSLLSKLGFTSPWLDGVRYELQEQYSSINDKRVSAKMNQETWQLGLKFLDSYSVGDSFDVHGVFDLWVYPYYETEPDFKLPMVRFHYIVRIFITE